MVHLFSIICLFFPEMFTVITRTSTRPRFFAECRRSVVTQTEKVFHLVSSDNPNDTYIKSDKTMQLEPAEGRGHNLYFNELRRHVPDTHPWIIFLDDDDRMNAGALTRIKSAIEDENTLILWRVDFSNGRMVPPSIGLPPTPGNISGIGFCYHLRHWVDWPGMAFGDFHVISQLYNRLNPVWLPDVLTALQAEPGGGRREDLQK